MTRFIKLLDSLETEELQEHYPNAFLLLIQISKTARRTPNGLDGLQVGDSIVGEKETSRKAGLSTKQYRNALDQLEKLKYIEVVYNPKWEKNEKRAIKRAIKSKVVNVINLSVCDYNPQVAGDQKGDLRANKGRSEGDKQEGIRKKKKEEEEHTHHENIEILKVVGGCDLIIPFEKSTEVKKPKRIVVERTNGDHVDGMSPKPKITQPIQKEKELEANHDSKERFGKEKTVQMTKTQYDDLLKIMTEKEREYWIDEITLIIGREGAACFNKKNASHYHAILYFKKYREENAKPKSNIIPLNDTKVDPKAEKMIQEHKDFAIDHQKRIKNKNIIFNVLNDKIRITAKREGNKDKYFDEFYTQSFFKRYLINFLREIGEL